MWKRFVAAMAAIFFLTAAGSATAVLLEVDSSIDSFFRESVPLRVAPGVLDDVDAGRPQTILVLGSDRRWGDRSSGVKPRSDTIILIRLDPSQDATAVLSVPRDLKVDYRRPDGSTYADKINAAYEVGGPTGTVRKVKQVMQSVDGRPFPIHHVVNINFGAFTRGVKALGCFYIDVDRRYFNDNAPPRNSATNYATIDLKPGYQKLCGQDSLDFVRFRHLDTDIVRGARQQHFLSQAKDQFGVERLFNDREKLLTTFGRYTDTDIADNTAVLRLLKLAYESSRNPLRRVRFRANLGASYVTATQAQLRRSRDEFLEARASAGAKGAQKARRTPRPRPRRPSGPTPGLERAPQALRDRAIRGAARLPFPVLVPRYLKRGSRISDGFESMDVMRTYDLYDDQRRKRRAYRLTVEAPGVGEYYGVQGTTWKDAPIVRAPDEVRGRYLLFRDGSRLRLVAWKTDEAVYWVSNTLLRSLTNRQMLAIARSATRAGAE
jgi:LCP family protein required for cell wall assembly